MSQLDLFAPPVPPFEAVPLADGAGWRWKCPHCDGSTVAEGETLDQVASDPACALCRAEFAGLRFVEWRRLPQEEKDASKPPVGWRSRSHR